MTVVRDRAPYSGTAGIGIFLMSLSTLIPVAVAAAVGIPLEGEGLIFLGIGVVMLVVGLLAWRFGAWAKVLGILAILGGASQTFFFAFGVFSTFSFVDFTAAVSLIVGFLVGLIGCIAALIKGRKASSGGNGTVLNVIAVLVVLAAAGFSGYLNYSGIEDLPASDENVEIETSEFAFEPDEVTVQSGEVSIIVHNSDPFAHTFTIDMSETYADDEYDANEALTPFGDTLVTFEAASGTYTVFCVPHTAEPGAFEESDMTFTLVVE